MNVSAPFVDRPVATTLVMAALLLLGLLGYRGLPVAALPTFDFPTIQVTTTLPGAGPELMASAVTTPLEQHLGTIAGLEAMSSTSSFGYSAITLQFALSRNIDSAAQDVQAAIRAASGDLPRDLPNPPIYNKVNPAETPILVLAVTSQTLPLTRVHDLAENVLAQKLSQVDGVGLVSIEGGQKRAVRIQANPQALAALGLSLEDLRATILQVNVNAPKGNLDGLRQSYAIAANDQLFSADTYADVILSYRNDGPVRVRDVATVVDGVENTRLAGWYNGQPAIVLNVSRQPGANIIETVDRIKTILPALRLALPAAVRVHVVADRTETIRASVADVQFTLVLTVALVVLVIFLFLRRLWATVIPSVTLPLSLLGTFAVMNLAGFSLNNLSLMALTIAAGFVVDDAIVMIENVYRYVERGESPRDAALKGASQIAFTVVSLTASLVAVFIPLLFMGGIVGRLFHEFAVTLSVAVVISAIVSLTLTPMMCARFLRVPAGAGSGIDRHARWYASSLRGYERSLRWVLRHRQLTLAATAATLAATVYLYVAIPKGFLPLQDTGVIVGVTEVAHDASFAALAERQRAVGDAIARDPDVAGVVGFVGVGAGNRSPNTGRLYIALKPRAERSAAMGSVIDRLQRLAAPIPGIRLFLQAAQDVQLHDRVSRTQYQFTLQSADAAELARWSPALLAALRQRPALRDAASDQQEGGHQTVVAIDRQQAARLGVSIREIDNTLYSAFGQRQISTIYTQLHHYHVILEVDPAHARDPSSLSALYVRSESGRQVPLSAFATIRSATAPLLVSHIDRFPAATLSFNLAPGFSLGEAVAATTEAAREVGLPDTVATAFVGTVAEFRASLASQPILLAAAIIVVYIVLGILYESYRHPLTILSTLPSAGVGALLALMAFDRELDIISLIGIILLIGIVKKNAIIMIDFALDAERREGASPEEAIVAACLLRFRPIMMTTLTALLAGLPLAFDTGTGHELRQPMGIAIVGGLLLSQFLTLYTTPVIHLAVAGAGARRRTPAVLGTGAADRPA